MFIRKKPLVIATTLIVSLSLNAQDADPQTDRQSMVETGIAAFNEGDYQQALTAFRQAEAAGNASLSVDYNIAVSLYRLGEYEEAERRFMDLGTESRWEVLVNYNLGLLYEAKGDQSQARQYYEMSVEQQEEEKIRELASDKLAGLEQTRNVDSSAPVDVRGAQKWQALLEVSSSVDSNASSLADELLEESGRGEDSFSQLLGYGHVYVAGEQGDGLRLYGLAFARQFDELSYLDSRVYGLGTLWQRPLFGWQSELGLSLMQTELDSRDVARQLQISSALQKRFKLGTLRFGLSWSDIAAGEDFRQIDGQRARFDISWAKRFNRVSTSLRARHEWNDRQDLRRGNAFASYSPTRNSLRGKIHWQITDSLSSYLESEYIASDYEDSNLLRDLDGSIRQMPRQNDKLSNRLGIAYEFNEHWQLSLEYEDESSDDNYSIYDYDKGLLQAALEIQL